MTFTTGLSLSFWRGLVLAGLLLTTGFDVSAELPHSTVFVGEGKFHALMRRAEREQWGNLAIGDRTAAFGRALLGTPYVNYTLEIDDHIESPSVNFDGMDCWTFFEIALAAARLMDEPSDQRTPQRMLYYIELDRYRGGICDGSYLSRLHYLEDWAYDNARRGLVHDLGRELGGTRARIRAREMTIGWKSYRYLRNNPSLLPDLKHHEERIQSLPAYYIPRARVAATEKHIRDGDIIGIWSHAGEGRISTTHVGLAVRDASGTLRFMHATTQKDLGRQVALDSRLSEYINRLAKHAGIMVVRPLK